MPPEASTADSTETVTIVPRPAARRPPGLSDVVATGAGGAQAGAGAGTGEAPHGAPGASAAAAYAPPGAAGPAPADRVAGSCHGLAPAGSPVDAQAQLGVGSRIGGRRVAGHLDALRVVERIGLAGALGSARRGIVVHGCGDLLSGCAVVPPSGRPGSAI